MHSAPRGARAARLDAIIPIAASSIALAGLMALLVLGGLTV